MAKRIVITFDGTWNKPDTDSDEVEESTNVCLFHKSVLKRAADGRRQVSWYDQGVGTRWWDRILGGATGLGLSQNVREGYSELVRQYEAGDELYVLGFSRGAYTARSLVGFVRKCGILAKDRDKLVDEAYDFYKRRDVRPDHPEAVRFRQDNSRETRVKFLGVWDTVGALGIPIPALSELNREVFDFNDTQLSRIVENAFHAVAINERRKLYAPTIWNLPQAAPGQRIEQRWFPGVHSDIGGGYDDDRKLADVTLLWMQLKALGCGLELNTERMPEVTAANYEARLHDSAKGIHSLLDLADRPIGKGQDSYESLDDSVIWRYREDSSFRPPELVDYFERNPGLVD